MFLALHQNTPTTFRQALKDTERWLDRSEAEVERILQRFQPAPPSPVPPVEQLQEAPPEAVSEPVNDTVSESALVNPPIESAGELLTETGTVVVEAPSPSPVKPTANPTVHDEPTYQEEEEDEEEDLPEPPPKEQKPVRQASTDMLFIDRFLFGPTPPPSLPPSPNRAVTGDKTFFASTSLALSKVFETNLAPKAGPDASSKVQWPHDLKVGDSTMCLWTSPAEVILTPTCRHYILSISYNYIILHCIDPAGYPMLVLEPKPPQCRRRPAPLLRPRRDIVQRVLCLH